ncbi:MAG: HEAT repeat domain-containing protein, partial [Verrucomicrobiota bacterium]
DHHRLEALWTYRRVGSYPGNLVTSLMESPIPDARAAAVKQLRYGQEAFEDAGLSLLLKGAQDKDAIVRMEAVIASTYFGTEEALEAVTPVFDQPQKDHLKFAAHTALISEALVDHWKEDETFAANYPAIPESYEKWGAHEKLAASLSRRTSTDSGFDSQKNLFSIEINCVPERMIFDITEFTVKAGQPVKLSLLNPDSTLHNLVIVEPGAAEEIGIAGNEMAKDPKGLSKGFIPKSKKILHHTKLLEPDTAEVLRFKAPMEPGVYPYLCTFPGHWIIMKGEMTVK